MNQVTNNNNQKKVLNVPVWFDQNTKGQQLSIKQKNKFMSNAIALVNNKELSKVTNKETILSAVLQSTLIDLPLEKNFGYCWVVPYKGQAQFQMGYKGYVQLALRSQQYKDINVIEVRKGEIKKIDRLKGIKFNWIQDESERLKTPIIGYIASFKLRNGFYKELYMSKEQMIEHFNKYSESYKKYKKFPISDFDSMALKTVLTQLLRKWGIMSVDMQQAYEADQAVIIGEEKQYIDNPNNSIKTYEINTESVTKQEVNLEEELIQREDAELDPELLEQAQEIDKLELN